MMIDKVKVYRLLFLFCFLAILSTGAFAQTVCEPVGGVCPSPAGVTCTYAANIEKGCNCFDGVDNDGNGTKDSFDPNCAYYYGLSIAGTGGQCPSIGPPPGSNVFNGVSAGAASSQNTCDTPAHLSVGDINKDGVPDILSTSKWNSTIQIVSTTTTGSWSPGDIMGDYKTQGKNIFPSNGNDWVFEHETGIADIDGDGYSEMFAIASKRVGGPNNPPTEYALCGFAFDKTTTSGHQKDLIPLWNAVSLGTTRPGNFGLADFNGDGKAEIYLRNEIFAAETGVRIANAGGNWQTAINAGPMAADMDNDGKLELVCGNYIYKVPTLSNRATTDNASLSVWKDMNTLFATKYYPKGFNDVNEYGVGHASTTSVADVDIDGNLDVLITGAINCSGNEGSPCANSITTIFYWNVAKGTLSTFAPPDPTNANGWVWGTGRINLYDVLTTPSTLSGPVTGSSGASFTGDNKLELLFLAGNKLYCYALGGSLNPTGFGQLWVRTLNDALSGIMSLTNYDFDNDGKPETVYRDTKAMVVVDGQTGATVKMSKDCASHTFTEGPIIADVNGDGATDICVPCYTNFGSFDITKSTPQQQSLGQTTLYYTDSKTWLPTRKVWNQFPYIVTNILDNMTLPKVQVGSSTVYSGTCSNGITDPRPYNLFMDQVPYLVGGCPTFPSPNVTFLQEDGTVDLNGDGSKTTPSVVVTPPICGNLGIQTYFNIINTGNLGLSDNIPVSFFYGDPRGRTNLSGTITSSTGSTIVTGTGTSFLTQLVVGQTISNSSGIIIGTIASITSNTSLTLTTNAAVAVTNGTYVSGGHAGTITCTTGSKVVTGVGTSFTTELTVGSVLFNSAGTVIGTIASITSNTSLTLVANGAVAVSGQPYLSSVRLYNNTMTITNLGVDATYQSPNYSFNGPGTVFDMYVVMYNNGSTLPIVADATASQTDCSIKAKIWKFTVGTTPFTVQVDTVQNNHNCPPYNPPNNGQLKARVFIGGVEQLNLSGYSFQWYTGASVAGGTIIAGATNYNLPNLDQGTYTVRVTNTAKGCSADGTNSIIRSNAVFPPFQVNTIQNQTICSPANGELTVTYTDGTVPTGYTFTWMDLALIPIGVTGYDAKNLLAGSYKVQVTRGTCIDTQYPLGSVTGPTYPDASVTSHTDVVDCVTPNSGTVTGDAMIGGVVQPSAGYTFTWYFYNNATGTTGSVLPAANNDPADPRRRINLAAGWYQLIVKNNATQCSSTNLTIVEVKSSQVIPSVNIFQKDLQTSCDATQPNAKLYAIGSATGFLESALTYTWYRGDNTTTTIPTVTVSPEVSYGPNNDTLKFAKGGGIIYTVKVTTPNNCSATNKFTPVEDVNQPVITLTQTPNDVCDPALTSPAVLYDGTVTASVTFKGVAVPMPDAKYTFNWYDGTTTTTAHTPATTSGSTLAGLTITGLQDGKFFTATATRTDLHCTSASSNIMVQKASIQPIIQAVSTGSNNCVPDGTVVNGVTVKSDGTATANIVTNPLPAGHTYTYQWYQVDPVTGAVIATLGAANNGTSQTATGLGGPYNPNRQYRVDVIDRTNGCTNNTTQSVSDVSVVPVLSTTTSPNSICSPATNFNGGFTVSLTNPVGAYVYPTDFAFSWYNSTTNDPLKFIGNTNAVPVSGSANTTSDLVAKTITLNKLDVGDYAVVAQNNRTGCTSSVYTNKVITAKIYPSIVPAATGSNNCVADGTVINGFTVKNDGTASYSLNNVPVMPLTDVTQKWFKGAGDPTAGALGASIASTVTLSNVGGPNIPAGSAPHPYTVLVTNTITGCANYSTASVPDNSVIPVLGTSTTPNSVCDLALGFKGTFTASLTNPVGAYAYPTDFIFTWKDGTGTTINPTSAPNPNTTTDLVAKTITLNNLETDSYTVIGQNYKTGCTSAAAGNAVGNNKIFPVLTPLGTASNNCVTTVAIPNDGSATVTATGTPGGYDYKWFNGLVDLSDYPGNLHAAANTGVTTQTLPNVGGPGGAHQYTVYVKDQTTGCTAFATATVPDNGTKPILTTTTTPNDICSPATSFVGTMTASLSNAQVKGAFPADFTFAWKNSDGTTHTDPNLATLAVLENLDAGSYSVVGTNNKTGCFSDPASNNVADQKVNPVLAFTTSGSHNCSTTDINGNPITPDGQAKVDVTPQGPTLSDAFTYTWTKVGSAPAPGSQTDVASPPSSTIKNVGGPNIASPGTPFAYDLVVKNNRTGCTSNGQAQVADASAKPVPALQPFDNSICDPAVAASGKYNGHVDVTGVTDNIAPGYTGLKTYKYTWTDVTNPVVAPHPVATQTNTAATSYAALPGGDYTGVVTIVELGCVSDPVPAQVKNIPVIPVISTSVINNSNCVPTKANYNGSVAVSGITESGVAQALTNYNYAWYDGATVSGGVLLTTVAGPDKIQSHTYTVQVTSKTTGCQGNTPSTIVDARPTIALAVNLVNNNHNCVGTPDGKLKAAISVNTIAEASPLTSNWTVTWSTSATGETLSSLAKGTYSATAVDSNTGCSSNTSQNTVIDSLVYPVITVVPTDQTSCDTNAPNGKLVATSTISTGTIASAIWYDGTTVGAGGTVSGGGTVVQTHPVPANSSATLTGLKSLVDYTVEVIATTTGCSSTHTDHAGETITYPVLSVNSVSNATVCSPVPDGAATFGVSGSSNYDLYYAYTSEFSSVSYPTDPDTVKNLPGSSTERVYGLLSAQSGATISPYANMAPGYLTAYLIDKTTSCPSNVETAQVLDKTSLNKITILGTPAAGFCGGVGGGIEIGISGGVGPYTFAWHKATPTNSNINFFTNPPQFTGEPLVDAFGNVFPVTSQNLGAVVGPPAGTPAAGVGAGAYTIVVKDSKGCGAYYVSNVPFVGQPNVVIDTVNVARCVAPFDGEVKVTLDGPSTTGYTIQIFKGNSNAGANVPPGPTATTLAPAASPLILDATALASGDYYIQVIDQDLVNKNCPLGYQRTLQQLSLPPKIDFTQVDPNTSCIPGASADGEVSLKVTDDPNDRYTIPWRGSPAKNYEISNIVAPPSSWTGVPIPVGPSGTTVGPIKGFKPQSYTFTVTEVNQGCTNTGVVVIPDVQDQPDVLSVTTSPEYMCAPSSNGKALAVIGASIPLSTYYTFTWAKNSDLTSPNYIAVSNGGTMTTGAGELLNSTHATSNPAPVLPTDPVNYWPGITPAVTAGQGVGTRTFYVQGQKTDPTQSGYGCKTSIVQVDIPDNHLSPTMTLATEFDSYCQATSTNNIIGDGQIIITAATADDGNGSAAATYDYAWNPDNSIGGGMTTPQINKPGNFTIQQLGDGTYNVTATNRVNKCTVSNPATIAPSPIFVKIKSAPVINDQRICNADGQIDVTEVYVDVSAVVPPPPGPLSQYDDSTPASITANYTFEWYPADVGNPGTYTVANLINDTATPDPITGLSLVAGSGEQQYAGMKAGTYYVVATRKAGSLPAYGVGCPSLPFRVDVKDLHQNPVPTLTVLSNTSCDPAAPGEGEIIINPITDNTNAVFKPVTGFTYNYTWSGGNALTLPTAGTGNGNGVNGDATPVGDKDDYPLLLDSPTPYSIAITNNQSGCTVTAAATVLKNSVPVFVQSVITTDQILCDLVNGDGSITVDTVKVNNRGGTVPSSLDYVVAPGAGQGNINNFTFDWSRSTVVHTQTTAGNALTTVTYDKSGLPVGFGTPIGADTYTVVATRTTGSPGRGCKSAPFSVVIKDLRVNPAVTLTPLSNTSCDNTAAEGSIKINVKDNTTAVNAFSGFTYTWTAVPPTQTAPVAAAFRAANDGDGFGGGENDGVAIDNDEDHPTGLLDGPYTMTVQSNKSQCITTASTTVPQNAIPVFVQTVLPIDPILCTPLPDGSLTVHEVTLNAPTGVQTFKKANLFTDFQFEWTKTGDTGFLIMNGDPLVVPTTPLDTVLNKTTYTQTAPGQNFTTPFGVGSYSVVVRRKAGSPGANCASAPYTVTLQDKSIKPVVALKPFANTACSGSAGMGTFEGEIEVRVTDQTVSNSLNPFTTPFKYNYTNWTTTSTTPIAATVTMPNGANNGDPDDGALPAGSNPDLDGDNPKNLEDGDYTVTVVNPQTGCSSTGTTTIYKNSTPVFTQLVTPTDQILCYADGKLKVDTVKVIDRNATTKKSGVDFPISDFGFIYDRTTVGNNVLGTTLAPSASTILDKANYGAIGFDTYFVTATRVNGNPGFGCSAAPYKVDILDKRIFPSASLTPLANTSCDPLFFEGEIKVRVADANTTSNPSIVPVGGFTFDYNWTLVPASSQPILWPAPGGSATVFSGNDGDGYGGGEPEGGIVGNPPDNDNDHPKGLADGDYAIQVTNFTTGCASPGQTTIFRNSTPVFTQLVLSTPQRICLPSGHLIVDKVEIIDRDGLHLSNKNGDFPLSDFNFTFDRTTVGNTIFTDVADNIPHLDSLNYPAVVPNNLFDTYYVTAKRRVGFPGKDCASAPYKVDIEDKRIYPTVKFRSIANSTCPDPITGAWNKANGSLTAIASEPSGANTDPYTFKWTLNGTDIALVPAPAPVEVVGSPIDSVVNALDGAYIVTVTNTATGCPFDASYDLLLDQTRSTPNIIEVIPSKPTDCNPSASANVTQITLGSTTNSTLFPPQIPPNNILVPPNLGPPRFVYTWYEGSTSNPPLGPTTPCIGPACPAPTVGLHAGDHFVTVIDNQTNCQSGPKQFTVLPDNIIYPVPAITQTRKDISCIVKPGNGAILEASATETDGTTGSYTFTWYPSLDLTGTAFGMPPASAPNTGNPNTLTDIHAGDYSVNVLNTTSGCTASAIFIVPPDNDLFIPAISTGSSPQTYCTPPFDGDVNVRVILDPAYPLLPYDKTTFITDLYKGTKPNLSNPPDVQANVPDVFTGASGAITYDVSQALNPLLVPGKYTFRVTDNNTGCFRTDSVEILLKQVKPVIVVNLDNPMTNCDPFIANGQLSATADGLIQGYTFDWYAGSTATGPLLVSDDILSSRDYGNYTVHVTNNLTGCFDEQTHLIDSAKVHPVPPTAVVLRDQQSCFKPDGSVAATVQGKVVGYSFAWTYDVDKTQYYNPEWDSVKAGLYYVEAKDDFTHCKSKSSVTVKENHVMPKFDIASTPAYCCDSGIPRIGTFTLTPKVNVEFAEIKWTHGDTPADTTMMPPVSYGPVVFDLCPGKYYVSVTTSEGCKHGEYAVIDYEIKPYNLVSPNSNNDNNHFVIDCISNFPNNNVKIFNRSGTLVYEVDGYATDPAKYFRGVGERGVYLSDKDLPEGTYFYIIDKRNGTKPKAGFLELVR